MSTENGRKDGRTDGRTDGQTDRRTDGQTDGTDGTDGRKWRTNLVEFSRTIGAAVAYWLERRNRNEDLELEFDSTLTHTL